jgi:type III restriction enzyme
MADTSHFTLLNDMQVFSENEMLDDVESHIVENLNPKFRLRPYQKESFSRFQFYLHGYKKRKNPAHLLFQMATGSGKTLIMAGCILHLYKKGYRNFLFFVNSSNIIEKTRDNFLNKASGKYLFNSSIQINGERIRINEVDNFQVANDRDINIHFTTIQGLHSRMNNPKENAVTFEDFKEHNVVMLSDEAHHMNVDTKRAEKKKLNQTQQELFNSWEGTVMQIFEASQDNILLEFTATADLGEEVIAQKYQDKLIYDYSLKQFYLDKYSKEVNVLQADLDPLDRALQAVILSQYRLLVFAHHNLMIKPVVMFKSNYVNRGKTTTETDMVSSEFREEFLNKIEKLSAEDIEELHQNASDGGAIDQAFNFFKEKDISNANLALQLKEAFSENKCISVDSSSDDTSEARLKVNSLEDPDNQIRAVFAVEALNEGWDALNLFDIVRLYEGRGGSRNNKPAPATVKEAQLIGRGARYCPFRLREEQPKFQRKYDEDLEHPLRICEELYFHSKNDSRYISELNTALDEVGIKPKSVTTRRLNLKESFKDSSFYKNGIVYLNEQEINRNEEVMGLPEQLFEDEFPFEVRTGFSSETTLMTSQVEDQGREYVKDFFYDFLWLGERVIRKAIQKSQYFTFSNLKRKFPHLASISEFISSENYLGGLKIKINGHENEVENLDPKLRLQFAASVLKQIEPVIEKGFIEKKGTKVFKPKWIKETFYDKKLNFNLSESGDEERGYAMRQPKKDENYLDLSEEHWYAFDENFGTNEEKKLVKFIKDSMNILSEKYDEVHLLRNEKHFKLYNFGDERVFEPDFLLHLSKNDGIEEIIYQVFIEPKGTPYLENDSWKEDFLTEIENKFTLNPIIENKDYKLIGMPFFNSEIKLDSFQKKYEELIDRNK